MNVLRCLQCNKLSAAAFICEVLQSQDTDYETARSMLTGNAVQICKQLRNNKNSHVETLSWASAVMREELCDEVSKLSLAKHGLHFNASMASMDQLELGFTMALLDSRGGRHRCMSRTSVFRTFEQDEMDLGEFGGDDPGPLAERDDEESSDGGGPGKHLRKWQHRANNRNVALLTIMSLWIVISIFLQSSNEKCNSLQSWMGFFMKSMCIPEKAIEVLAHAGLSISLSSIHNAVTSMSKEISSTIRKEVHTLHAAFAYDNFNITFNTAQPSLENHLSFISATSATVVPLHGVNDSNCHALWSSAALWVCDPRNTSPSSFPLMNEMRSFLVLHKNDTYNRTSDLTKHSPCNAAFTWHICLILVHHAAGFRQFQDNLGEPESVLRIPIHKTTRIPCRAMNIKQSTTNGNVEVLDNLF
ncbi:hypothetical protein BDN67DRAFT_915729 [Paxillus ammoniavirescens]|nr:hypothetical protein BDN67DRAFT_915729 [Paxillus ammoniavirescens]